MLQDQQNIIKRYFPNAAQVAQTISEATAQINQIPSALTEKRARQLSPIAQQQQQQQQQLLPHAQQQGQLQQQQLQENELLYDMPSAKRNHTPSEQYSTVSKDPSQFMKLRFYSNKKRDEYDEIMSIPSIPQNRLSRYRLLGNSGLRVSPLSLGTLNFGDVWEGNRGVASQTAAEQVMDAYVALGGNFIDTANRFHDGQTEQWIGEWMQKRGNRDQLVLATKYGLPMKKGVINSGGNHRKNLFQSVEESLKRLQTHYIDLLYVHFWDYTTPTAELLRALDDVVRMGKVHYIAIADTPSWEVARANTMAELKGWSYFIAYQGRYHLLERDVEWEIGPMCEKMNIGFIPWGVLGQGRFTTRYISNLVHPNLTPYEIETYQTLKALSTELGRSPSQIALNWTLSHKFVTSLIIGCRTVEQLKDSVCALDFKLSKEDINRLNGSHSPNLPPLYPYTFIGNSYRSSPWLRGGGYIE